MLNLIKHFIITSSSYSNGQRIALHYVIDEYMDADMLTGLVRTIKDMCGKTVSISTHYLETESSDWSSISEKDSFFEKIYVVETMDEFVYLISVDRILKGIDIAKYILASCICTHLALEKLVYLCYADYLCATGKRLFEDQIYAFKYGPVIKSVYETYKGMKDIEEGIASDEHLAHDYAKMPARSRILFADDGMEKIAHMDATIKKYGRLSASELVQITHVAGGPWDAVDKSLPYAELPDSVIIARHCKETI